MSDKYYSVNECTQEISESKKLHSRGVEKCPSNLLGQLQLANCKSQRFRTVESETNILHLKLEAVKNTVNMLTVKVVVYFM